MSEQDQQDKQDPGFTVKDRRLFSEEGEARSEPEEPAAPQAEQAQEKTQDQPRTQGPKEPSHHSLPPVDFSALILSLSHAAMMHLGHIPDPMTGESSPDLELARHTIDTIGMLKDKTAGNLDQDEQRLIDSALTELRMAFVRASA